MPSVLIKVLFGCIILWGQHGLFYPILEVLTEHGNGYIWDVDVFVGATANMMYLGWPTGKLSYDGKTIAMTEYSNFMILVVLLTDVGQSSGSYTSIQMVRGLRRVPVTQFGSTPQIGTFWYSGLSMSEDGDHIILG